LNVFVRPHSVLHVTLPAVVSVRPGPNLEENNVKKSVAIAASVVFWVGAGLDDFISMAAKTADHGKPRFGY